VVFSHICKIKQKKTLQILKLKANLERCSKKPSHTIALILNFNPRFPAELNGLTLSLVDDQKVFLIAENASVAFRAKRQKKLLISIIRKIDGLSDTKSLAVRVDEKKY
jgi:hypothetical protein